MAVFSASTPASGIVAGSVEASRRPGVGRAHARHWRASLLGLLAALLATGGAVALHAVLGSLASAGPGQPPPLRPPTVVLAAVPADAGSLLGRFALNALLAPLIDDSEPPRWTDVALAHVCGPATRVQVDGRPLVPGALLPATAFTLRWQLDGCEFFDGTTAPWSGAVELQVFHEAEGLGAVVDARGLVIGMPGAAAEQPPQQLFAAGLSLATHATPR